MSERIKGNGELGGAGDPPEQNPKTPGEHARILRAYLRKYTQLVEKEPGILSDEQRKKRLEDMRNIAEHMRDDHVYDVNIGHIRMAFSIGNSLVLGRDMSETIEGMLTPKEEEEIKSSHFYTYMSEIPGGDDYGFFRLCIGTAARRIRTVGEVERCVKERELRLGRQYPIELVVLEYLDTICEAFYQGDVSDVS